MSATRWWPFAVRDGVLTFGRGAFTPDGFVARGRTYAWDDVGGRSRYLLLDESWSRLPEGGWWFDVELVFYRVLGLYVADGAHRRWLGLMRLGQRSRGSVAMALALYLRSEPAARPGLADPARVRALFPAMRATYRDARWHLPHVPMMGDKHDLHVAVLHAYREALPRRYADLRVDVDPPPDLAQVVARARLLLRPGLRDRFTDEEIAERARQFVERTPWPFSLLTP